MQAYCEQLRTACTRTDSLFVMQHELEDLVEAAAKGLQICRDVARLPPGAGFSALKHHVSSIAAMRNIVSVLKTAPVMPEFRQTSSPSRKTCTVAGFARSRNCSRADSRSRSGRKPSGPAADADCKFAFEGEGSTVRYDG